MIKAYGKCAVDIEKVAFVSSTVVKFKDGHVVVDPMGDFSELIAAFNDRKAEPEQPKWFKTVTINLSE